MQQFGSCNPDKKVITVRVSDPLTDISLYISIKRALKLKNSGLDKRIISKKLTQIVKIIDIFIYNKKSFSESLITVKSVI